MLYVVDSSTPLDENDEEIIEMLKDRKAIVLYNKTDLVSAVSMEALKEKINHPLIPISAKEETGIAQLADTIKSMFLVGKSLLTMRFILQMPVTKRHWKRQKRVLQW